MELVRSLRENFVNIEEDCQRIIKDYRLDIIDYKELSLAIISYLSITIDKLAEHNTNLCRWISQNESFGYIFGRQALSMTWDYPEMNPFSGTGGDFLGSLSWILEYLEINNHCESICVEKPKQGSAANLNLPSNYFDAVLTDPPYYDNIPYATLSDFFYVWLKRTVGNYSPNLFATPLTQKESEVIAELPLIRGVKKSLAAKKYKHIKSKLDFENLLSDSFLEIYRVLKPGGIAVIVYAHKTTEGWETMLNGLIKAGLVVTGSWPLHTEKKGRLREIASAALASSIYMVCRKIEKEQIGFWNELQPSIKNNVEKSLKIFWNQGITGGDFFISAIGPGMEEYSKYERVESYSGEKVGIDQLLSYIRSISTNFLVNRLLADAGREAIDKEAQFYLTYRWTYLDNRVEFDDARKIASAQGVDLEKLWQADGFVEKRGSTIQVRGPKQRSEVKEIQNMVDAMHRVCQLWEKGRKADITDLLGQTGYGQSNAFWQFCQAIAETLVNGNKEKQLLEGLLMDREKYARDSEEVFSEIQKPGPKQEQLPGFD